VTDESRPGVFTEAANQPDVSDDEATASVPLAVSDIHDYLRACLGDAEGYLIVAFGSQPYLNGNGKYDHKHWQETAYAWPAKADLAEQDILRAAADSDVYVCPYVMPRERRTKWAAVARTIVHADVDGDLDLEKVRTLGGFAVGSGSHGHAHVYVALTESVSGPQHEALCRGLGCYLGAVDSKCSDNDLLRPPGTLNHKPTVTGGRATPVGWGERP
jgi:putative DNA primase/helicase